MRCEVDWRCWVVGAGRPTVSKQPILALGPCLVQSDTLTNGERLPKEKSLVWMGRRTILHLWVEPHLILFGYTVQTGPWHRIWLGPFSFEWTTSVFDPEYASEALLRWFNHRP